MRTKILPAIALGCLWLISGLLIGVSADEQILKQREAELRSLKAKLADTRRRTAELRSEGKDLEKILSELERQRAMTQRYLRKLAEQQEDIEQEITDRRRDLAELERQRDLMRGQLAQVLRRYYKEQRLTAAELLISSKTFGELFARVHYLVRSIRELRSQLSDAQQRGVEIREEIGRIEQHRGEVLALQEERRRQLAHLEAEEKQRQAHREELQRTITRYEEQARKLIASQEQIEKLIQEAQRAARAGAGDGLGALRGRLPWPVEGPIVSTFGTEVHPRYGTRVEHKGIQIAAKEGTPIRAVAGGLVVFDGWFEGYGQTVILDHGEGYFSLYAHASQVLVSVGTVVEGGSEIARVGSTDSLKGPGLHFEIRRGPQALNPAAWLSRRGG